MNRLKRFFTDPLVIIFAVFIVLWCWGFYRATSAGSSHGGFVTIDPNGAPMWIK